MDKQLIISPNFKSHSIKVLNSYMHYFEQGEGNSILFLHSVPMSGMIWQSVLPLLATQGRCIALDLIGMGQSGKPDIEYTAADHIRYVEAFIQALQLRDVTLVMQGWGSVMGCDYAMRHEDNIRGLIFYESHFQPVSEPEVLSLPVRQLMEELFNEKELKSKILDTTYYIDHIFPKWMLNKPSEEMMQRYRAPFLSPGAGQPIWQYLQEFPQGNASTPVAQLIERYSKKLECSQVPKLLLYSMPGFMTPISTVVWAQEHFPHLTVAEVGEAFHDAPMVAPYAFAQAIQAWLPVPAPLLEEA